MTLTQQRQCFRFFCENLVVDVPSEFIPYIQSGDSIIKESNSSQITLISFFQDKRTVFIHP